jgi:exo-beta-1,3-glucanase (GH17 family)
MSYRSERYRSLIEVDNKSYLSDLDKADLSNLFLEILQNGMHGLCFSMYQDGQKPGDIIEEAQVSKRMLKIKPHTKWVRSFSCIEGNEHVATSAKKLGMNTLVGAWLGSDLEDNEKEITALIKLCKEGYVDIAAVGNEVMYRGDLTEEQLLSYISRVKQEVGNIPVGYVDAYYEFTEHPAITDACDVILANCYPYWEGYAIEESFHCLKKMYYQALEAGKGKRVIITETGWPSQGENLKSAVPSEKNALEYFINAQMWAIDAKVEMFYFSSFDESWKVSSEGEVGAYWGLWDKDENLKFINQ